MNPDEQSFGEETRRYEGVTRVDQDGHFWVYGTVNEMVNGHARTAEQLLVPKTPISLYEAQQRLGMRANQQASLRETSAS